MKPVFTELFVTQVKRLQPDVARTIRDVVTAILAKPMAHDSVNWYPWDGCFEKVAGAKRIIYCVCRVCKKRPAADQHTDCNGHSDDTVVFRMMYTVF